MNAFERFGLWLDDNPRKTDATFLAIVLVVVVPFTVIANRHSSWFFGQDTYGLWSGFFAIALVIPLFWRRTAPLQATAVIFSVALIHMLIGPTFIFPADLAVLAALYAVTIHGSRWASNIALLFSFVGAIVFGYLSTPVDSISPFRIFIPVFTLSLLFLTVWAFALMRKAKLESLRTLKEKNRVLEVEAAQQLQLGAAGERARIAREMHDIVAHSLSVMIAQADGGRYAAKVNSEFAETALGTIAETGRAALADMRRLLGVLREDSNDDNLDPRGPQPASGDIEPLVAQLRMSGIRVSLVRMGTPRTLPPGAGLTLYRICQESLTNVLKHAGPDPTVTVLMSWGRTSLNLEVEDDGRGAASAASSDGAGMGLIGMKERAALFGGTVKAGPKPGGGYRVELTLPLPEIRDEPPGSSITASPSELAP